MKTRTYNSPEMEILEMSLEGPVMAQSTGEDYDDKTIYDGDNNWNWNN